MRHMTRTLTTLLAAAALTACGGGGGADDTGLSGSINIDGSSTVYPVSQAIAEEFMRDNGRGVRVTVSQSGTGGGFQRFCAGETEISNASRPIKDSERELCEQNGVEPIELEVAMDGITIAVNPASDFVVCLTTDELRRVWEPGSAVRTWAEIRQGFPDQQLKLYGPGTSSGTFDYFTEAIMGEEDRSRQDYTASEDDNVLVQGVAGDRGALGYFGFAYYEENQNQLKAVAVDDGSGCIEPTRETIASGQYAPLARPMFIYVSGSALERPEVRAFVEYYMEIGEEMVPQVGYVPLQAAEYQANLARIQPRAGT